MKIYYITRTWTSEHEVSGGAAMFRKAYADLLSSLANVVIVTPTYDSYEAIIQKEQVSFPYNKKSGVMDTLFQYAKLKEDYLDEWVGQSFKYLRNVVSKEDIIYSVTGGDLASIKLGALLKREIGCKLIVSFMDPVDGTKIFGEKIPFYYGFCRDNLADKYILAADLLFTSSELYQKVLIERYPEKSDRIYNHYIGYLQRVDLKPKENMNTPFNIVFTGVLTGIQNAEILYEAFRGKTEFTVTYICRDADNTKKKMPEDNINCIELMPHSRFLEYMHDNADAGFVGLKGKYLGVCVPTRLYEFLNLGLPILAALPEGSAKDIINKNEYGIACSDHNAQSLLEAALRLKNEKVYKRVLHSIQRDRDQWYFYNRTEEFLNVVRNYIS